MARFGWLHLSDLHLGAHGSRLLQPEYREAFEQDLRRLHAQSGPWHAVFISGDLTLTGSRKEFQLLDSTLGSLWDYLRSLGSDPCLLPVPGNHDIWEGDFNRRNLRDQHRSLDVLKAFREKLPGKSPLVPAIWDGFAPFTDWFHLWRQRARSHQLENFRPGLLPGDFVITVRTQDLKVAVVGLNSTFRSSSTDASEDMHEVDWVQIDHATGGNPQEWVRQHDFLVLLTHYPPSKLHSSSLIELGEKLAPSGNLLLHLCSSQHAEGRWTLGYQPLPWSLAIHAPSLFGEQEGKSESERRWGYIAGEVDTHEAGGRLKIFPRIASSQKGLLALGHDSETVPSPHEALTLSLVELLRETPADTPEVAAKHSNLQFFLAMTAPAPLALLRHR